MTKRKREYRSPEEGQALVKQWRASGLSATAFARQQGIGRGRVLYWSRRSGGEERPLTGTPRLVAVTVKQPEVKLAEADALEVLLRNGRRVRIHGACDEQVLRRVLAAAEAEGC